MTKKLSAKITDFGSMSSKLNAISHEKDSDLVEETSLLRSGEQLMYDPNTMTRTVGATMTQGIGTPLYMAPEVIDMAQTKFTLKTDVFSFGVLMWEVQMCEAPDLIDQEYGKDYRGPMMSALLNLYHAGRRLRFSEGE